MRFQKFAYYARRPSKYRHFFIAMNADGDIVAHRVDFILIKQFQKLDSRYCAEKYKKLEQRLITRDVVVVGTEPPSSNAVRRVRTTKIWWRRRRRHRRQRRRWRCRSIPEPTQLRNLKVWNWPRATNPRNTRLIYNGEFDIFFSTLRCVMWRDWRQCRILPKTMTTMMYSIIRRWLNKAPLELTCNLKLDGLWVCLLGNST